MSEQHTKLGTTPPEAGIRDAVHVAVISIEAGEDLSAGALVRLRNGKAYFSKTNPHVGIADPWRTDMVAKGDLFWLCLNPGSTSNLRHTWAHPLLSEVRVDVEKEVSHRWLIAWCRTMWPYDADEPNAMLGYLIGQIQTADGNVCFGIDDWRDHVAEDTFTQEFWHHYECYTGKARPKGALEFRCAC